TSSYDNGNSAYAGIENAAGTEGHMYSDSSDANLTASLAVRYIDLANILSEFNLLTPADGATIDCQDKGNSGNETAALNSGMSIAVEPTNGKASVDVDFTWEAPDNMGPGTVTYDWICDDDAGFGSPDHTASGLTSPDHTENFTVTEDETWYWRVTAIEDEYSGERDCNDDFEFNFDHTAVEGASLGEIKAEFK
ncbi:MAG: hypothetical protein GY771_00715, partial [bacterium]|nr:hypothetical protein [bacterium]